MAHTLEGMACNCKHPSESRPFEDNSEAGIPVRIPGQPVRVAHSRQLTFDPSGAEIRPVPEPRAKSRCFLQHTFRERRTASFCWHQ